MTQAAPLRLVFLWHFHQPWYLDFGGGPAALPWVRLHALKDYVDLPNLLSAEPRVPHAANLVPALLDQLEHLLNGGSDTFLDVARRPASEWDDEAADFLASNFFSAHPRMMEAFPHYGELARRQRAAAPGGREAVRRELSRQDLRDLAVLFHLAWSGPQLRRDPLLVKLRRRGHRFSEADKSALLDRQAAFLADVIPAWKRAFASGVVEAATSPYHHPILPLLVDSRAAREALPRLPLPDLPFRRPEDARAQLALGLATFERYFGFRPAGMWPPEGAVSEAAVALIGETGTAWIATDEEVLFNSLSEKVRRFGPGDRARTLFRPYRLAGGGPAIFFRDRALSDRIGFSYASWPAEEAAADFVERLLKIQEAAPETELVVPVILDGENAWESYPENGEPFLKALTSAMAKEPRIRVVTPSQALAAREPARLPRLVAGSWINGSLTTWIGDPAKNRAWRLLGSVREALAPELGGAAAAGPLDVLAGRARPPQAAQAAVFAAEASDWFWWFGEEHSTAHDPVFDALFRAHLAAAHRALGRTVIEELELPVEVGRGVADTLSTTPVTPELTGARPDYFEWLGAGRLHGETRGTMGRGAGLMKEILFGFAPGGERVFLRVDPAVKPASSSFAGHRLRVLLAPQENGTASDVPPTVVELPLAAGVHHQDGCQIGVDRIVEIGLPHPEPSPDRALAVRVVLLDAEGREVEAVPAEGWARFRLLTGDWSA